MKHLITDLKASEKISVTLKLISVEAQQSSDRMLWKKRQHRTAERWQNVAVMYHRILIILFIAGILEVSLWVIELSSIDENAVAHLQSTKMVSFYLWFYDLYLAYQNILLFCNELLVIPKLGWIFVQANKTWT